MKDISKTSKLVGSIATKMELKIQAKMIGISLGRVMFTKLYLKTGPMDPSIFSMEFNDKDIMTILRPKIAYVSTYRFLLLPFEVNFYIFG